MDNTRILSNMKKRWESLEVENNLIDDLMNDLSDKFGDEVNSTMAFNVSYIRHSRNLDEQEFLESIIRRLS